VWLEWECWCCCCLFVGNLRSGCGRATSLVFGGQMIGVGEAQSVRGLEEVGRVGNWLDVAWRSDRGESVGESAGLDWGIATLGNGRKRGLRLGVDVGCWGMCWS
jgi:hypothetical protein